MSIARWMVCVLMFGLLVPRLALADDPLAPPTDNVARDHLSQGNRLYRMREFERAIEEYKTGALREDANVFLYNLGQCYRQLGKYDEAIWHYERFLTRAKPSGDLKTAIEEFVRQMRAERERRAMTQPPIEPAPDAGRPTAPTPSSPMAATTTTQPTARVSPWYADQAGWALTGTGVVATGISAYFLLDAVELFDQANNEQQQSARSELRDKAGARRLIGAVVGIGGLGLLATGIIKLVIHPSGERGERTSWGVGVSDRGVQVFGSF